MAIITPNTTYPNGAVLPVASHNANVYSTTSGRGVMSEPNGGLQVVNLDAAFTVRDEHIMPEEAVVARMDSSTIPMDLYNNAFGIRDDDDPAYVPIAGLGLRVYVPYAMSAVVWQWSFHVSLFKPYMVDYKTGGVDLANVTVRLFIDGVDQPIFRRNLPISADLLLNPTAPDQEGSADAGYSYDHITQLWYDVSKLQQNVSAGYHELTLKVYLPRLTFNPGGADPNPLELSHQVALRKFTPSGTANDPIRCVVHTRVSFGVRNVRCVMFK